MADKACMIAKQKEKFTPEQSAPVGESFGRGALPTHALRAGRMHKVNKIMPVAGRFKSFGNDDEDYGS